MAEETEEIRKKKRDRSPSYPAIDLEEAIDKVRIVYREERRNLAPVRALLKHWGYGAQSSTGILVIAALKKFGLVVDQGSGLDRKAKISDDAFNIIVDERADSSDRLRLIRDAALRPPIHSELWERYKEHLPSDTTLKYELRQKGFTERAIDEFVDEYKKTIQFAKLNQRDILSVEKQDKTLQESEPSMGSMVDVTAPPQSGFQTLRLPLTKPVAAFLSLPLEMDEKLWKRMQAILEAMKPSILNSDEDSGKEPADGES